MTRFSIVIPTRNRAHTLPFAVRSALDQPGDDFEVLVSDNFSTDETAAVVAGFGERVRRLRPPEPLTMPDHWNWAVGHATGEWVIILADDDAFCPGLLPRLRALIAAHDVEIVTWLIGRYHHNVALPDANKYLRLYYDPAQRNKLELHSFTGRAQLTDSAGPLRTVFAVGEDSTVPRGHNCAIRRDLFARISGGRGLFLGLCPDYACSAILLAAVERYLFVDEPLQVFGSLPRGGAATYAEQIAAEFKNVPLFDQLPIASPLLVANHITDTLVKARAAFPGLLGRVELDWAGYFLRVRDELTDLVAKDIDTSALEHAFVAALAKQPQAVQRRVRGNVRLRFPGLAKVLDQARHHRVTGTLRRVLYGSAWVDRAIGTLRRSREPRRWLDTYDGARFGFNDIYEAARFTASRAPGQRP